MKQGNPADIVYDYIKNQIVTKAIYPASWKRIWCGKPVSAVRLCARR